MSTVRLRRLQSDFQKLREYVTRHPRLQLIQAEGEPPERYQLEYRIKSLRQQDADLLEVKSHLVEISLPRNYPRTPPQCRMLTPIFHPNIAPHAICIGDHWSAGEPLWSIVARIGELIAYQSYNVKSPLNGEAARWVTQNEARLPLDAVSMLVEEGNGNGAAAASATPSPPRVVAPSPAPQVAAPPAPSFVAPPPSPLPRQVQRQAPSPSHPETLFPCTGCSARLRVTPERAGHRVRCPKCGTILTLPSL